MGDASTTTGAAPAGAGEADGKPEPLNAETVAAWAGAKLTDIAGGSAGKVEGAWCDAGDGSAVWLLVRVGRFRKRTAVPAEHAAEAAGRVWVPYDRELLREAPEARPGEPLTREQELELCSYWGIPETTGRAAAVASRAAGEQTAKPG